MSSRDAVVVGSGPNGLAAAISLAQAGVSVTVFEAAPTLGGGLRSAELTLPGFVHDVCAAVLPTAVVSPFFRGLELERSGLEWAYAPLCVAHPFRDGTAAVLATSLDETAASLEREDGASWRQIFEPLIASGDAVWPDLLGPLRLPQHPL